MNPYDHDNFFKEQINDLISHDWKIVYDDLAKTTKIINEEGEEISPLTLGFAHNEIIDYINRREERQFGEKRKTPLDELSKKRFGIQDYLLIEENDPYKKILEAYHDKNGMFILERFFVSSQNNLKHTEYTVCLTVDEAELILESLQGFVEKNKR